jgi:hypothetical protein
MPRNAVLGCAHRHPSPPRVVGVVAMGVCGKGSSLLPASGVKMRWTLCKLFKHHHLDGSRQQRVRHFTQNVI